MSLEFDIKTSKFFNQDIRGLSGDLLADSGMVLAIYDTNKMARIKEARPYVRLQATDIEVVGERYKNWGIEGLNLGDLWNPPSHGRRQSLVIGRDHDGIGACVRLLAAEYWDPKVSEFVKKLTLGKEEFKWDREGDIARYFGLQVFERSVLKFLDETNRLYVVSIGEIHKTKSTRIERVSPDEANSQILGLLGS